MFSAHPLLRLMMSPRHLRRSLALGVKSIWLHKLRSMLTALGIVFGVGSVIAMLAIGEGLSEETQNQIRQLGSQNVILQSVRPPESDSDSDLTFSVNEYGLTARDLAQIRATIPGVSIIAPAREMLDFAWRRTRSTEVRLLGTIPDWPGMRNRRIGQGRFFNDLEVAQGRNVCVINEAAARELMPLGDALGSSIRIQGSYFRVIGVMADGTAASADGDESAEAQVMIPLTSFMGNYGDVIVRRRPGSFEMEKVAFHEATIRVDDQEQVLPVANAVRHILERNHPRADYRVVVPVELLRQAERTKRMFSIVLGSIAAISLLVGGIGIMNIMLASVTERTREIGIRRALGARRSDIILQFLIETVLLSGIGGVIGVVVGLLIPAIISHSTEMTTIVRLWSPTLALSISVLVGILFGIYPAIRAARMNPVDALRHE